MIGDRLIGLLPALAFYAFTVIVELGGLAQQTIVILVSLTLEGRDPGVLRLLRIGGDWRTVGQAIPRSGCVSAEPASVSPGAPRIARQRGQEQAQGSDQEEKAKVADSVEKPMNTERELLCSNYEKPFFGPTNGVHLRPLFVSL